MKKEDFSTVIQPKTKWFDLKLKQVLEYRDLIFLFVKRNFVSKYKQTVLYPIWAVIQPLLTTVVFTLVFGNIAGLAPGEYHHLFFICQVQFFGHILAAALLKQQIHSYQTAI